jgi:hypothetical protein
MSQSAAEHHRKAAEHHKAAAEHHESGDHHKAGHHAHIANGHHIYATHHAEEASKHHANDYDAPPEVLRPPFRSKTKRPLYESGRLSFCRALHSLDTKLQTNRGLKCRNERDDAGQSFGAETDASWGDLNL